MLLPKDQKLTHLSVIGRSSIASYTRVTGVLSVTFLLTVYNDIILLYH